MPITCRQDVGLVLLHARVSAQLTQYEASRLSGIGQPDISAYETGRKVPGFKSMWALLTVYGWELQVKKAQAVSTGPLQVSAWTGGVGKV